MNKTCKKVAYLNLRSSIFDSSSPQSCVWLIDSLIFQKLYNIYWVCTLLSILKVIIWMFSKIPKLFLIRRILCYYYTTQTFENLISFVLIHSFFFSFQGSVKFIETNMWSMAHFVLTLLHLVQMTLAYFLMLIVMTYNSWLCGAVILGIFIFVLYINRI